MKKTTVQALTALALALLILLALDRLTNRLDVVEGHAWDFVYYIDMAENGVWGNPNLAAPYAYRFITPLLARGLNQLLGTPTFVGFKLLAYGGLLTALWGVYFAARKLGAGFWAALVVMSIPAGALFNVKFLLFDFYRPDQLAYPLLVFAILALMYRKPALAVTLGVLGLLIREYLIIPIAIALFLWAREWWANRKDVRPLVWMGLTAAGTLLVLALPRWLIPITMTQQILDPFNDPQFLKTLFGMPLNWKRNYNYVFNLAAYWMPLLILATPGRLRRAWQGLGAYRPWIWIYLGVNLLGMMYGGTDMMRYATFFFIPQAFFISLILQDREQPVHVYEVLYLWGALVIFNRLLFQFPIWDFNAYLDFYAGYGDVITRGSALRWAEWLGLTGLGAALREVWLRSASLREMTLDALVERLPAWAR